MSEFVITTGRTIKLDCGGENAQITIILQNKWSQSSYNKTVIKLSFQENIVLCGSSAVIFNLASSWSIVLSQTYKIHYSPHTQCCIQQ